MYTFKWIYKKRAFKPNIQCFCKIHGKAVYKFWFDFTFSTEFGSFAHLENISSIYLAFARLELLSFFIAIFKQLYGFNFDCSKSVGGGLVGSGFGSFVMIFLSCESSLKNVSQDFKKRIISLYSSILNLTWTYLIHRVNVLYPLGVHMLNISGIRHARITIFI